MGQGNLRRFLFVWLGLVLVFAAWATRTSQSVVDVDLWHELALARETFQHGAVPQTDSYAYTPTITPVVDHEWGAGMLGYWALSLGGAAGIAVLTMGLLAVACFVAVACAWLQKGDARSLALAGIVVAPLLAMGFQPVRAQDYSLVCFAILLLAIHLDRQGKRWVLAAWCPVFVVWVNCHASYVLVFIFLGVYFLTAMWERKPSLHILGWIALCAVLIAVNPYGLAMYPFLWRTLRMARPFVEEWAPVWHGKFAPLLRPFLVSIGLTLYAVWHHRAAFFNRTKSAQPAATILIMGVGGMIHVKLMPYYALAFLAYFPGLFVTTPAGQRVSRILAANRKAAAVTWAAVMLGAVTALVLLRFWVLHVPDHGDVATYPAGAVGYMARQHFQGNLMTPFNEGAYVSWKLSPGVRVSMDSRYDVAFPERLIPINESVYGSGSWRGFVSQYPTDMILARRNSAMEASLAGAWKRVYSDGAYALFERPGLDLPVVDEGSRTFEGTLP